MNCREAQELFGLLPDLPEHHPQRKMLEWHILGCESCAAEYQIWSESLDAVQALPIEVSEEQAEAVNRKVMDRIYAESPWLAPDIRDKGYSRRIRRRVSIWAACFLAVFLFSTLLFALGGSVKENQASKPSTGIVPAAVAAADTTEMSQDFAFALPGVSRGIVEPFVVQLGPAYPQYWMLLSMAGMALALISWKGIRRYRR
ncbi:zf-HC2 domain-containing protein [Fontibacillus sp. BL9]|uniref:zf-HC2 domain-containing protein n=1 Tax=Fontibacillus sp. BL9 TaxID=3389971 RepID=UPI003978B0ED